MDLRIQFSHDNKNISSFEKLCQGHKQFRKNSITRKELITLFKEAQKEHIEENKKIKKMITNLQRNSFQKTKNMRIICSYCKQIKNEQGEWKKASEIVDDLPQTEASHGICPECYKTEMDS